MQFSKMVKACSILALSTLMPAFAQGHLGFEAYGTFTGGGDSVCKASFTDGSTQDINAGQGFDFGLGAHYKFEANPIDLNATIGYKWVTTKATNANVNLSRTVLELRADYIFKNDFWIGTGPVWHSDIKLNSDGYGQNAGFDNAQGLTVKGGWRWIALAYTSMRYKDEFGYNYDANSIGVTFVGKW